MLDNDLKQQMQGYLAMLQRPIELIAHTDDGEKSVEMQQLLTEIASLSEKITLVNAPADANTRTPSFAIRSVGDSQSVSFAGLPLGHEFTSLVLALLQVGGHPSKLSAELINQVKQLTGEYQFESYFSLTCQNCPDVVQALNLMAVLNPNIKHTAIEGSLFQDEVERRQIMTVPSVFLNGKAFAQGRMGVEEILDKLDTGSVEAKAQQLTAKDPFDVLIVGAGPAGAAAAIYAARKGLRTGLVAARFGGQVLDTMAIENFISVEETEGPKLVAALEQHVLSYPVEIMTLQQATALHKTADLVEIEFASGAKLKGKTVILATGANWRNLGVPGEQEYRTKGVTYCPHCDGPLFKGKDVAVIGGGNSGAEAALDLAGVVKHVTLLEFAKDLRADAVLQDKLHSTENITVITKAQTTEVIGDGKKVTALVYKDLVSGDDKTIELAGIFVQIGLLPNTTWLKDSGIELSKTGEIVIDSYGKTSLNAVFAAGDVTTVPYKQIIIAMGEGSKASLSAFDYLIRN